MPDVYHHGTRVTESQSGPRPVRTPSSSAIVIWGTAPDAGLAVAASLETGSAASKNGLKFTAAQPGLAGNAITVELKSPKANNAPLAVSVTDKAITVSLATDGTGVVTSTAALVKAAVAVAPAAAALVAVADLVGSDGTGVVATTGRRNLAGGLDEAFPENTPVLVAGRRGDYARIGKTGTLPAALDDIFDQCSPLVVVIKVPDNANPATVKTNLIGSVDANGKRKGIQAALDVKTLVKVKPRIFIAPGFTHDSTVVNAMLPIADRLRARIYADGPNTTDADAISYRENFGSRRVFIHDPYYLVEDRETGDLVLRPASARLAGVRARVDMEKGYHWPISNQLVYGIKGIARPIDFELSDPNCRANLLNSREVATTVFMDGWRTWGSRTTSDDPVWAFESHVAIADAIYDAIESAHLWAVDRNITATYESDVRESINNYLRYLTSEKVILGGKCWLDQELNSADRLRAGKIYWNFDFSPPPVAEDLEFIAHNVTDYYEGIFKQ